MGQGRDVLAGGGRHGESVKDDMKLLGLQSEWAIFTIQGYMWRDFIHGAYVYSLTSLAWNR